MRGVSQKCALRSATEDGGQIPNVSASKMESLRCRCAAKAAAKRAALGAAQKDGHSGPANGPGATQPASEAGQASQSGKSSCLRSCLEVCAKRPTLWQMLRRLFPARQTASNRASVLTPSQAGRGYLAVIWSHAQRTSRSGPRTLSSAWSGPPHAHRGGRSARKSPRPRWPSPAPAASRKI